MADTVADAVADGDLMVTMPESVSDPVPADDIVHSEFVHISQEHDSDLCNKLYKQWQDLQHCDLTLALRDGELRAHTCIVAAFSPKLKAVLENARAVPGMGGVYVRLMFDAAVLRCLLNMMYTGVLSFNTAMLSAVSSAARWLQMDEVVRLCQDYREVTGGQEQEAALTDENVLGEIGPAGPEIPDDDEMGGVKKRRKSLPRTARKKGLKAKRMKRLGLLDSALIKRENDDPDGAPDLHSLDDDDVSELHLDISDGFTKSGLKRAIARKLSRQMRNKKKKKKDDGEDGEVKDEKGSPNDEMSFLLGTSDHITCKKCLGKFTKLEEYRYHIMNHPTFACDMCSMSYYRKSNLTRHRRTSHSAEHHLNCKRCEFTAKSETELRTHSRDVHQESKPFKCEHPGCTYASYKFEFLNRHSEIHSPVKHYVCDKCGQGFAQSAGLISHHKACYQLQQYLCDLCGQAFNHIQSMRAHRRTIHLGEKPFTCRVCNNRFSDGRNLKRHMRIHENAFPYQCDICKQKYRHSNSLKAHLRKHGDSDFQMHALGSVQIDLPEDLQRKTHEAARAVSGGSSHSSGMAFNAAHSQHMGLFSHIDHPASLFHDGFRAELEKVRERSEAGFSAPRSSMEDMYYSPSRGSNYDLSKNTPSVVVLQNSSSMDAHAQDLSLYSSGRSSFLSSFSIDSQLHSRMNESHFPPPLIAPGISESSRRSHLISDSPASSSATSVSNTSGKGDSRSTDDHRRYSSGKDSRGGGGSGSGGGGGQSSNGLQTLAEICFTSSM